MAFCSRHARNACSAAERNKCSEMEGGVVTDVCIVLLTKHAESTEKVGEGETRGVLAREIEGIGDEKLGWNSQ